MKDGLLSIEMSVRVLESGPMILPLSAYARPLSFGRTPEFPEDVSTDMKGNQEEDHKLWAIALELYFTQFVTPSYE